MVEAVLEPIEGAPASIRRRWSDDFKLGVVAESFLPGARPSQIAQRIGVETSQIFQWRKQAVRKGWISLPVGSAKKTDRPVERAGTSMSAVEIVVDDITIRAGADVDEGHLVRVIRAVRQA